MLCHTNRTDPWAAAAMWDAEGFVQVQMADIRTEVAWPAKDRLARSYSRVHVNLAAATVHDLADLANRSLENAVCAWIGDHQCGQIAGVRVSLCPQIGQINVTIF